MSGLATYGLLGMFLSAFLAATILPFSSEVVLVALAQGTYSLILLGIVASLGNVAGAVVNYIVGYKYGKTVAVSWLRMSPTSLARAEQFFNRWGRWSLLLAWVPVIGDPLTLLSGVLRTRFVFFITVVSVCKSTRYAILLMLFTS
ncbi:YqaA family protein [Alteromonas sp. A079]|uniref:YqaA family protein n=1 Tax=Alteromonas sp. A079 TaxID=3410268 RepID=UPI003B9E5A71